MIALTWIADKVPGQWGSNWDGLGDLDLASLRPVNLNLNLVFLFAFVFVFVFFVFALARSISTSIGLLWGTFWETCTWVSSASFIFRVTGVFFGFCNQHGFKSDMIHQGVLWVL